MEWGSFATIGFTAAGNPFYNNDPSSNEVACINRPDSDWTNIVYLLSNNNPEIPPPSMYSYTCFSITSCYTRLTFCSRFVTGNLRFEDITNSSATATWTIPFVSTQQTYTLLYGYSPDTINITAGTVQGNPDTTLTNQNYSLEISGLDQATTYYVQVVSTFEIYTLYSDAVEFTTQESGK